MQMTSTVIFSVGALVLSVIAAGWDIATRRIPNLLTLGAIGCACGPPGLLPMDMGWLGRPAGLTVGLGLLLPPRCSAAGRGDLKLMAALGALLGPGAAFETRARRRLAGGVGVGRWPLRRRQAQRHCEGVECSAPHATSSVTTMVRNPPLRYRGHDPVAE